MSLSRSFEQSCLVCIVLQNSCFFPERPVYKSILLFPSADSPHFWESNTAPKGEGPARWKQKPADIVASSDPCYVEWNITYLTVWFTNFSGGAQLVGRWTVKRQDKDLRSAIFWTSKQKEKRKTTAKPKMFYAIWTPSTLGGKGRSLDLELSWFWISVTRCTGVHVSCINRRWFCVSNLSQMYELRVSEATSVEDPREKTVSSLKTKICSFMRFWYSYRKQQLCCFHLMLFLASATFNFPFCLFSQDHSAAP